MEAKMTEERPSVRPGTKQQKWVATYERLEDLFGEEIRIAISRARYNRFKHD